MFFEAIVKKKLSFTIQLHTLRRWQRQKKNKTVAVLFDDGDVLTRVERRVLAENF